MRFGKMHGLGNDFIILDSYGPQRIELEEALLHPLARRLCDRHFGIGADGILLILPSSEADFRMRLINADGSEAQHCGNGIRCVARYVYDHDFTAGRREMTIETTGRLNRIRIIGEDEALRVEVDFGPPGLERETLPMAGAPGARVLDEPVRAGDGLFALTGVSMGNPHAVLFVDDVEKAPVSELGPLIERHELFPERTNVEFVQVISPRELSMRVWERGAGETMACGTGACASVVAASLTGRGERRATVHLLGGDLEVDWTPEGPVKMTGPAEHTFRGEWLGPLP